MLLCNMGGFKVQGSRFKVCVCECECMCAFFVLVCVCARVFSCAYMCMSSVTVCCL